MSKELYLNKEILQKDFKEIKEQLKIDCFNKDVLRGYFDVLRDEVELNEIDSIKEYIESDLREEKYGNKFEKLEKNIIYLNDALDEIDEDEDEENYEKIQNKILDLETEEEILNDELEKEIESNLDAGITEKVKEKLSENGHEILNNYIENIIDRYGINLEFIKMMDVDFCDDFVLRCSVALEFGIDSPGYDLDNELVNYCGALLDVNINDYRSYNVVVQPDNFKNFNIDSVDLLYKIRKNINDIKKKYGDEILKRNTEDLTYIVIENSNNINEEDKAILNATDMDSYIELEKFLNET
jgi:hypothetical protein